MTKEKKEKIAISIDQELLTQVDNKVDGTIIRSRSQAIELYLSKGLGMDLLTTAVILLKGTRQESAFRLIDGTPLLLKQLHLLKHAGVTLAYIVTQHSKLSQQLTDLALQGGIEVRIVEYEARGNAAALIPLKEKIGLKDF